MSRQQRREQPVHRAHAADPHGTRVRPAPIAAKLACCDVLLEQPSDTDWASRLAGSNQAGGRDCSDGYAGVAARAQRALAAQSWAAGTPRALAWALLAPVIAWAMLV